MMTMQLFQTISSFVGGGAGVGVLFRWAYLRLSRTHRQAIEADTTRDLVEIATSMLEPSEKALQRLAGLLAQEEARADRLGARIKELEDGTAAREAEINDLRHQVTELKTQLLEAQLEAGRLRGLLADVGRSGL